MITVIENIEVYSPEYLGKRHVVIIGDKIEGIYKNINVPNGFVNINKISGEGKLLFPGFIDLHVHITGAGGEDGFSSRTPEINLTELTTSGITTVVGCLGTDNICRDMKQLIAKAKSLEAEGITTFCYTGSYDIPAKTITGNVKEDMVLIDKIIGVGEVALSDNRSSQPTFEEFLRMTADARVGGLLSGKAGIVHMHLGTGSEKINKVFRAVEETEIPIKQFLPTHMNRSTVLFNEGIKFIKKGGYIDATTSSVPGALEPGEILASKALKKICDLNLPTDNITFSSDGHGSLPIFNDKREVSGFDICKVKSLYEEVKKAILDEKIPIEVALKTITSNPAKILKLKEKGKIEKGNSADFVLVDKINLDIIDVYAKGKPLVLNKKIIVRGNFEC